MFNVGLLRFRLGRPMIAVVSILSILCLASPVCQPAEAQSLKFAFSGSYDPNLSYNDGIAFDGANYTDLPPVMDLAALDGGTFTASFTVPAILTPISQTATHATYQFGPPSSIQFTLFDSAGHARYRSSGLAESVQGNEYRFPFGGGTANQMVYGSIGGFDVLGVIPPPGVPSLGPIAQFNFSNYSDPLHTHLSDLSFPTDPATYLSFPERQFNVQVAYGDGDLDNGVDPFRFFDTNAYFTVNSVRVNAVPEPGALGLLTGLFAAAFVTLRKRHPRRFESV